jgi:Zn-dependent protease
MKTSLKIGTIIDIPIKIHFSFLFILALFAWAFSLETFMIYGFTIGFGDFPITYGLKFLLGGIVAILLFICVLLHELGHSYVTQQFGHQIKSITLFVFGGASESEEIPKEPKKEISIAIIGPIVSIGLGIFFYLLFFLVQQFDPSLMVNIFQGMFGALSFYNLILAGFNLIPAFPIDGGRVLRAAFATRMDYQKATRTAASIGKGVAVAIGVFGFFFNFWLVLIAIFIYFGAAQEQKTTEISSALEGKKIRDIMKHDFESVNPDMNLNDLYSTMEKEKNLLYPVVQNKELVGTVTMNDMKRIQNHVS